MNDLILRGFVISALAALAHVPLAAQAGWSQVVTTGPSARAGHGMVYDTQRGKAVLFGGFLGGQGFLVDTWEWDGTNWTQVSNTGPLPRAGHAMAYDSQRGRTVLFGGSSASSYLGDTWEWNGSTWTQVANTGPSPRRYLGLAYDRQRARTVLFGGDAGFFYGDTWEWDGGTWQLMATAGPTQRGSHGMVYDVQRCRTVMVGGENGSLVRNYLGDVWEWDGSMWAQDWPVSARRSHAMAHDSVLGRTTLFGGYLNLNNTHYNLGDTWERVGSTWTQVANTGSSQRQGAQMVYDSQRGQIVLFGGATSSSTQNYYGDTWRWLAPAWASATMYGSGCGNPALSFLPAVRPVTNTTATALLINIPASFAFVALGWSDSFYGPFTLPMNLTPQGMPGCELLQSLDAISIPTPNGPGSSTYSLPLPNWGALIGHHLYLQAGAFAPGGNAANLIASNAIEWVIGSI